MLFGIGHDQINIFHKNSKVGKSGKCMNMGLINGTGRLFESTCIILSLVADSSSPEPERGH